MHYLNTSLDTQYSVPIKMLNKIYIVCDVNIFVYYIYYIYLIDIY